MTQPTASKSTWTSKIWNTSSFSKNQSSISFLYRLIDRGLSVIRCDVTIIHLNVVRENFLVMDVYFAQLKRQKVRQLKAYEMKQFLGTNHTCDVTGGCYFSSQYSFVWLQARWVVLWACCWAHQFWQFSSSSTLFFSTSSRNCSDVSWSVAKLGACLDCRKPTRHQWRLPKLSPLHLQLMEPLVTTTTSKVQLSTFLPEIVITITTSDVMTDH